MFRRFSALVAVLVLGVFVAPAHATTQVTAQRLAGGDRYATAHAVAKQSAFTGDTVVIASAESYPDALSAASLGSPIVLSGPGSLPAESVQALDELHATRTKAVVVGGTASVPESVLDQVRSHGYTVRRIAGADRYSTAAFVAQEHTPYLVSGSPAAIVVSAQSFSDALAATPSGVPLLLVDRDSVPAATASALDQMGVKQVIIVGGTSAVSNGVQSSLASTTRTVVRVGAPTANETAVAMADYEIGTLGSPATDIILANGSSFPDGLTGGALGVVLRAPIILAGATLHPTSQNFLDARSNKIARLWVVGGTKAVSDSALAAAKTAASNVQND